MHCKDSHTENENQSICSTKAEQEYPKRARKESITDALLALLLYFFVLTQG